MSDPGGISTSEAGGLIGGAVTVLGMIGAGIAWLFGRRDVAKRTREQKLDAYQLELEEKERRLDEGRTAYTTRLEQRLAEVEAKEHAREAQDAARDLQMRALRIAFELVSSALRTSDPHNPALGLAQDVIRSAFPISPASPADMVGQLVAIETATGEKS